MTANSTTPATKPQPVLVAFAIMAGMTFIVAGLGVLDILPVKVVGLLALIVAGVNVMMGYLVRGQVVPLADAAAYVNEDRVVIAGPASVVPDGTNVVVVSEQAHGGPPAL